MTSPMQRSLELLRQRGYDAEVVEHRVPGRDQTKDLWGIADIIALGDQEVIAVQTTTASNMAARRKKIEESDRVDRVRDAGVRIHVHGWQKRGGRWACKEEDLS